MKRSILILGLVLTACNRKLPHYHHVTVPDELQPLVNEFIQDSVHYNHPIAITDLLVQFNSMPLGLNGTCTVNGEDTPIINLNSNIWPHINPVSQKLILYHELGHCVLGRPHNNVYLGTGYMASIMNAYLIDFNIFLASQNYYLNELFNP